MKVLYFDLMGGVSGDMIIAAFLDLGLDLGFLKRELKKVAISGYTLSKTRVSRGHIKAVKFDCLVRKNKIFSYRDITRLIGTSRLPGSVKANILKVYSALARAETKVHGHTHRDIHFDQLGEIDSIVDIVSICIALDHFGAGIFKYSMIPLGHDVAPATFELLIGKEVYFMPMFGENVTPTGMAILSVLGEQVSFGGKEMVSFGRCGYGAGSLDFSDTANVLRIAEMKAPVAGFQADTVTVIEANIDDMNPQFFEYIFDKLFDAGAYDVFLSNVIMKKSRPGFLLTVLSNDENLGMITRLILRESTTIGVRFYPVRRLKLAREVRRIRYKGFQARVKCLSLPGEGTRFAPEYDDCKGIARRMNIPIGRVYDAIKQSAETKL